ncbi:MAG TPA: adenylate/guanylate cyclase domain-containing protein, partial [Acidimicrobiia bacterium]|jgi:class 3 adenylate cyclase|nr:adenylate/guanylate cyclase domain-containing protein [Acidimicrobiia bacterium]
MATPELRFAEASDGIRIGYQRLGSGAPAVVVGEELNHTVVLWELPEFRRAHEYLAQHLELVLYHQRGSGNSDRIESSTLSDRLLDIDAVLDAAELERVSLIGRGPGAIVAAAYASSRPDRVDAVVISNGRVPAGYRNRAWELQPVHVIAREERNVLVQAMMANWGVDASGLVSFLNPGLSDDPAVVAWWTRFQRVVVSRDEALREMRDVDRWEPSVSALQFGHRALITHARGDRLNHLGHGRLWSEWLPHATFEPFDGDDHAVYLSRTWQEVFSRHAGFVSGIKVDTPGTQQYAAVLFTDIVSSTSSSLAEGDESWRTRLDKHDRLARIIVSDFAGSLVKLTGDGILATFRNPARAVEAAIALRSGLAAIGVRIRSGVHAGLIELRDGDISGAVVNLAARTMGTAPGSEIYITSSLRDQLLGSGFRFESVGSHKLNGFPTDRELYRVG